MTRDENGRFVKGNGGGPGRPKKSREERFMEITVNAVTFDNWQKIIKKAVTQALRGNAQARKFLADYLLGPATQRVDVTSGGDTIKQDDTAINQSLHALSLAIGEILSSEGGERAGKLDAEK